LKCLVIKCFSSSKKNIYIYILRARKYVKVLNSWVENIFTNCSFVLFMCFFSYFSFSFSFLGKILELEEVDLCGNSLLFFFVKIFSPSDNSLRAKKYV
jgi:hypothetical protein